MHTPGFEYALAHHRADLHRIADDHRAARRAGRPARAWVSRFAGLRARATLAGRRRTAATMGEAQPCPP